MKNKVKNTAANFLFNTIMLWTVITTVFAWLPLVRIIGRPIGYQWGVLGFRGTGTNGPYWIFIVLTLFVVVMLYSAYRIPRKFFYPMLILWHLLLTSVVTYGVITEGVKAQIQGQGLNWQFPIWIIIIPCGIVLLLSLFWTFRDLKENGSPQYEPWNKKNSIYLLISLMLFILALYLFNVGTNYNWVTSAAIITTVLHWILLVESFQPVKVKYNAY